MKKLLKHTSNLKKNNIKQNKAASALNSFLHKRIRADIAALKEHIAKLLQTIKGADLEYIKTASQLMQSVEDHITNVDLKNLDLESAQKYFEIIVAVTEFLMSPVAKTTSSTRAHKTRSHPGGAEDDVSAVATRMHLKNIEEIVKGYRQFIENRSKNKRKRHWL